MRLFFAISALVVSTAARGAEPIYVPDFTPGAPSEFALAFMLQERVLETLSSQGHVAIGGDAASPLTGPVRNCATTPTCASSALSKLPARWAVVVLVEKGESGLQGAVSLYERSGSSPLDQATIPITGGREQAFADEIVALIDRAVADLGGAEPADLAAARALVAGDWTPTDPPEPPEPPPNKKPPPDEPDAPVDRPPTKPPGKRATIEEKLAKAGLSERHIVGCRASFGEWDGPPLEWLFKQTPHSGRLIVEVRGGLGIGDVDRHADARLFLDGDGNVTQEWFQEGPVPSQRPRGALYLGYAPTTFLDIGAELGLQYGHRTLSTGIVEGGDTGEVLDAEVQAVQAWARPTVRLYIVPLGIAKPYLFVGADIRAFDAYKIAPGSLTFPSPPGGVVPGAMGGGGLMIDPGPIVGFFVEGGYTRHFGVRSEAAQKTQATRPDDAPLPPEGGQSTIAVTGGVQFRL